ncbi:MAG: hypothetical protein R2759_20355 [Bacteroidales bacterium]
MLAQHMKKEELVLFPYIRNLVKADMENKKIEAPGFGSIKNPIQMMEEETHHRR